MAEKKLTGKIARERIRSMETPPSPEGVIEGSRALGDASGIVSDVMDEFDITGIIGDGLGGISNVGGISATIFCRISPLKKPEAWRIFSITPQSQSGLGITCGELVKRIPFT